MADESDNRVTPFENVDEVLSLLWGDDVKEDIFERWSQGFVFSTEEPSALVQEQGGPCAVLASVQRYVFPHLGNTSLVIYVPPPGKHISLVISAMKFFLLFSVCSADLDILCGGLFSHQVKFYSFMFMQKISTQVVCVNAKSSRFLRGFYFYLVFLDSYSPDYHKSVCVQELTSLSSGMFHSKLCQIQCHVSEHVSQVIKKNIAMLEGRFGVLLFLYSMLLTKGIESIKSEMEDIGEPLVDINFGHGSQTLINLMLTGYSVSNIWDSSRTLSGLVPSPTVPHPIQKSRRGGIMKSNNRPPCPPPPPPPHEIYIDRCINTSIRSKLRIGCNLYFIFLMICSCFSLLDNGFITSDKLGNVLEDLGLVSDPEYVSFMKGRLDQDSMGIILLQNFLKEFFPGEDLSAGDVKPFKAFHYNGLGIREEDGTKKVAYTEGLASIEPTDFSHIAEQQIVSCLKTKWSGIWLEWQGKHIPSLN
ncbi:unnamed protein product [Porites evermanni]|uniref:Ubiquitin carboxyl-terminal hydrolase MINDY n=1 Tax=Porites evermanni TaxID=104178 RepID=A0ABN8LPC3_9CNID|nr:unnamed protein product [Porites evermanni]